MNEFKNCRGMINFSQCIKVTKSHLVSFSWLYDLWMTKNFYSSLENTSIYFSIQYPKLNVKRFYAKEEIFVGKHQQWINTWAHSNLTHFLGNLWYFQFIQSIQGRKIVIMWCTSSLELIVTCCIEEGEEQNSFWEVDLMNLLVAFYFFANASGSPGGICRIFMLWKFTSRGYHIMGCLTGKPPWIATILVVDGEENLLIVVFTSHPFARNHTGTIHTI